MTELLREALAEVETASAVKQATGVKRQSRPKCLHSEQSLRLDMADRLAAHFSVESRRQKRKG